jgi:hypothetical protein
MPSRWDGVIGGRVGSVAEGTVVHFADGHATMFP